jgi:sarcosine oxidase, subunit gamma
MPETRAPLSPRVALRELAPQVEGDAVVIRVLPPRARFSLRVDPSLLSPAKPIGGFALGVPINSFRTADGRMAMRLGPDEWLLFGSQSEAAQIARELEAALARLHHALVDLGHARVALSVSGPRAADAINGGCALDLSPVAFPAGTATRTLLGKAEIVLSRLDDRPAFEIECARSFAAYVRDFLHDAARQYRAED